MIRISILLTFICLFAAKAFAVTDLKVTNDNCEYKKPAVVYFATHAIAHPFWTIVENGAMEGARDACITLKWTEDVNFSVQTTIERMEIALTENPDVLVITATDPAAMRDTLERAQAKGIPVIAINVNDTSPPLERVPYMIYIGGSEYDGGVAAANRILSEGNINRALCTNGYPGHVGLEARCRGYKDTMEAAGIEVDIISTEGGATDAEGAISAYFLKNPDTNAYFATSPGPVGWEAADVYLQSSGKAGQIHLITFDLTSEILESIQRGDTLGAVDQQPYLQGYLASILARNFVDWGLMPYEQILTGPAIVDAMNAEKVIAGAAEKRR